jgi:hypothetical protein
VHCAHGFRALAAFTLSSRRLLSHSVSFVLFCLLSLVYCVTHKQACWMTVIARATAQSGYTKNTVVYGTKHLQTWGK